MEEEMGQLESQLRHSQKMEAIGTLSGGVAHEFNNMLGIILGNVELAMDDIPGQNPAREFLEEIRVSELTVHLQERQPPDRQVATQRRDSC